MTAAPPMTLELQEPAPIRSSVLLAPIRFAYADPPYPGCAKRHYSKDPSGIVAAEIDHAALIAQLEEYDAWALSTGAKQLQQILALCPPDVRVAAWVKPFAPFMPGVRVAYAWEPVIFKGARPKWHKECLTARDWIAVMPDVFRNKHRDKTKGTKPVEFCRWLFDLMGLQPTDELHDLFPGSRIVSDTWERFKREPRFWG